MTQDHNTALTTALTADQAPQAQDAPAPKPRADILYNQKALGTESQQKIMADTADKSDNIPAQIEPHDKATITEQEDAAFTIPQDVAIDEAALEAFKPLAKELGLSNENAQKLIDLAVNMHMRAKSDITRDDSTQNKEWVEQANNDAEFGGAHFQAHVATAQKALNHFASPALIGLLDHSGLGNHPEMIRLFFKIGQSISEDRFLSANAQGGAPKSLAEILYGSTSE